MSHALWRLPGYRVERLLGSGASGEVWQATVLSTGAPVALKRIRLHDPEQRKTALAEAAMLESLDHPHLVKLHAVRHLDDGIVLALDLAAGGSLDELLARRGRLTIGETITALAPIGAALAYAHSAGVVHGDVSAANILFTDIGLPLLADLGVARLLGDDAAVRTTPAYVDPVVADGAVPFPASDVFMLGAVALHALTGAPPWAGSDPAEVFAAAARGEGPDFAARLADAAVPPAVAEVVERALQVDPLQRGTAADFALELRAADTPVAVELMAGRARVTAPAERGVGDSWALRSVPAQAQPPVEGEPVPFVGEPPLTHGVRAPSPFAGAPARHLMRSRPRVASGLIACLVLLGAIAGLGVLLWPSDGPAPAPPPRESVVAHEQPDARSSSSSPSPSALASAARTFDARSVLARLDAERGRAFARRSPPLLRRVYASAALLARDRAQLLRTVPRGCAVVGLRSRFGGVRILARSVARIRLLARVTVEPARLSCAGMAAGRLRGTAPTRLRITLVRRAGEYRIAAEERA